MSNDILATAGDRLESELEEEGFEIAQSLRIDILDSADDVDDDDDHHLLAEELEGEGSEVASLWNDFLADEHEKDDRLGKGLDGKEGGFVEHARMIGEAGKLPEILEPSELGSNLDFNIDFDLNGITPVQSSAEQESLEISGSFSEFGDV